MNMLPAEYQNAPWTHGVSVPPPEEILKEQRRAFTAVKQVWHKSSGQLCTAQRDSRCVVISNIYINFA